MAAAITDARTKGRVQLMRLGVRCLGSWLRRPSPQVASLGRAAENAREISKPPQNMEIEYAYVKTRPKAAANIASFARRSRQKISS